MGSIHYSLSKDGSEVGRWFGKSIRVGNTISHENQLYLGKVIDKENLIFFKRKEGYYHFDPDQGTIASIPDEDVPMYTPPLDRRLRARNVIVTFGGSYFLHELIDGIKYNSVLDVISLKKPDTMYSLLHYYLLGNHADCEAFLWYQNSYARFLYPQANMSSQRISDFYVTFGNDNNRRVFFQGHISYLISATDDEYAILIDSTGCQNACKIPVTRVSKHNNETNIEFRLILVVQRSTGLPVYYEIIPGNVVDSSTISRIMRLMERYGFKVTAVFGDAGYSCPANIEKIIFCGSDLVMRLNPAYDMYKDTLETNLQRFSDTTYSASDDIRYRNRIVRVIENEIIIGTDKNGADVQGYIYLCRDMQAYHSKCDHYMSYHGSDDLTAEEMFKVFSKFGIFAIIMSQKKDKLDVIPFYYQRQAIEQFFDSAKNYAKMMPVRNHNINTVQGHMLMSFIATFLVVAIKNKMNILDTPYIAIPSKLVDDSFKGRDLLAISTGDDGSQMELIAEQEPVAEVYQSNPSAMFFALNFVGADVFEKQKDGNNQLIPSVPWKEANDYFKAFGIPCPEAVMIKEDHSLQIILKQNKKRTCSKSKVFAVRPYATMEEIEKHKAEKGSKKANVEKQVFSGLDIPNPEISEKIKKKRGRPPGSKNKKTLQKEADMAAKGIANVKRGRGRPFGSKDKKPRKRRSKNTA